MEKIIDLINPDEICPISSLQSDYEDLSVQIKEKLTELSKKELEFLLEQIKAYVTNPNDEAIALTALISMKGALQYRRVLGEDFYNKALETVKEQFYSSLK